MDFLNTEYMQDDGEKPSTSRDIDDEDDPDDLSEPLSSTAIEPGKIPWKHQNIGRITKTKNHFYSRILKSSPQNRQHLHS